MKPHVFTPCETLLEIARAGRDSLEMAQQNRTPKTPPTQAEIEHAKRAVDAMWRSCCNQLAKRLNDIALKVISG